MTTKARAVLSVHSSSRVNSFVPVTKSEENGGIVDEDTLPFDIVVAAPIDGRALLSLESFIVVFVCGLLSSQSQSLASFSLSTRSQRN